MPDYTLVDLTTEPYALQLTAPIDLGGTTITERRGLSVSATVERVDAVANGLENTATGRGDIAPLPSFNSESLADVSTIWPSMRDALSGNRVELTSPDVFADELSRLWSGISLSDRSDGAEEGGRNSNASRSQAPSARARIPASVRFGVEQAVVFAIARAEAVLPTALLTKTPRTHVSLNALLMGTPPEMLREARRFQDVSAVKVKVGRHDIDAEAACVRALAEEWGQRVQIRLDANRAWSYDDALRFADGIEGVSIEYLEEPLADPSRLAEWTRQTGVPIALDETTREVSLKDLTDHTYVSAVVVKPSLIGFSETLHLAKTLRASDVDVVISSAYESGVGLAGLAVLAASTGDRDIAAGLDTYRRLTSDVAEPRLPIAIPGVDVECLWDSLNG